MEKRPVLAPDDEDDTLTSVKFSLASDIVELVIFTTDDAFLQTLRDAVGGTRRLWHVPSADKISDLLLAGQVGILVLDVQAVPDAASVFVEQIKRQFPDLVIVVAGHRDAETALANLISAGTVYRFIHKPMSPGRAKLFADAAVRRYEDQRRRAPPAPRKTRAKDGDYRKLIGVVLLLGTVAVAAIAGWALRHRSTTTSTLTAPDLLPAPDPGPALESPILARAAAALAANRLTTPPGDNALDLYQQALTRTPQDADARAGLAEVHERLLARAENALLEERLDEAAGAIDIARKAGVDNGRIVFLTAQLAKSREQLKTAMAQTRVKNEVRSAGAGVAQTGIAEPGAVEAAPAAEELSRTLTLAAQRIKEDRLLEPLEDSARHYVRQAMRLDPNGNATQGAKQTLAIALMTEARGAVDQRDFARAAALLDAAEGIAAAPNIDTVRQLLANARQQADNDTWNRLLKSANERLQQDRLIEPANDSAKYYLTTLKTVDPSNLGLASALQDLGQRLVAKARRALNLQQVDAAHSWLEEATAVGYSSPESIALLHDLDAAAAQQQFLTDIVPANALTLLKSVQPVYPKRAEQGKLEGWVELDFTVAETGDVKDIVVHASTPPGVFDAAAMGALAHWHYKPAMKDGTPARQRSRIRMRFTLSD